MKTMKYVFIFLVIIFLSKNTYSDTLDEIDSLILKSMRQSQELEKSDPRKQKEQKSPTRKTQIKHDNDNQTNNTVGWRYFDTDYGKFKAFIPINWRTKLIQDGVMITNKPKSCTVILGMYKTSGASPEKICISIARRMGLDYAAKVNEAITQNSFGIIGKIKGMDIIMFVRTHGNKYFFAGAEGDIEASRQIINNIMY